MKNIFYLFVAGTALMISSCGDPAVPSDANVQTQREPIVLTDDDLFEGNIILAFLENEEKFVQEANELFLLGLDAFRNENNLDSADYYLRKSILKEPSAKAYFELGNVFMNKEDYESALLAFGVAEQLDYEPFSKILYNKACLYALQEENELAGKYLEYALQAGYNNIEHINKDEDLEDLRGTYYYDQAIERGLRGVSNSENLFWLQFKGQFSTVSLPSTLPSETNEESLMELSTISYDYEKYIAEMRDEAFSREVSKEFYYYSRPYETNDFVAIIYAVDDVFMGEYAPLTYRLATFTHEGVLIDKMEIGGRESLDDPILNPTLNKDMTITISEVMPEYENDPDNYGYYENPMISSEEIGSYNLRITNKGMIVEAD
ncbi:MAG: hypothetical protein QNK23_14870 [Crocinitomicaceae bacterium]|nr:hypothetical protein [Crocinitomicaceae bacterium]